MKNFGMAAIGLTILVATSDNLSAQDNSGRAAEAERAAQKLNPGRVTRVRTDRETIQGQFSGVSSEGVILARGSGSSPIPFTTIEEMWKQGRSAGTGALIGAGIGGVLVGGFGVFLAGALCDTGDGCRDDKIGVGAYGAVIGAAGGGLIGAGIGALVKRWVRIYP